MSWQDHYRKAIETQMRNDANIIRHLIHERNAERLAAMTPWQRRRELARRRVRRLRRKVGRRLDRLAVRYGDEGGW